MRAHYIQTFYTLLALLLAFHGSYSDLDAQVRLYHTTRYTGSLQELDVNNGAVLANNVAGISSSARGMDFSPLGGLYICLATGILRLDNPASTPTAQLSYTGEFPHDLCFDASGNLYVVTDLNVYVYTPSMVQVLTFPHNLTTVTGTGGTNKGWGIEIRPDNGEIYVGGRQGLRRFDPSTGALLGSLPNTSLYGFPCLKFTSSGFNNVYLYLGSVISGQDQIRVYDSNLNFLRWFFPSHNGNPIDLEIHPTTQDIYLTNTDGANPTNRYLPNETLAPGWATFTNPGRGLALGDFAGVVLPEWNLGFGLEEVGEQVRLFWHHDENSPAVRYFVERSAGYGASGNSSGVSSGGSSGVSSGISSGVSSGGSPGASGSLNGDQGVVELGWVEVSPGTAELSLWDTDPMPGGSRYRLVAVDVNGEIVATENLVLERAVDNQLFLVRDRDSEMLRVAAQITDIDRLDIRLMDMGGKVLLEHEGSIGHGMGDPIDLSGLAAGVFLIEARAYDQAGDLLALEVLKFRK